MRRQSKKILTGFFAALGMHILGMWLLGVSVEISVTSRGIVDPDDLLDPLKTYHLLQDPSFKQYYSWGWVTVDRLISSLMLGLVFPLLTFVVVTLLSFRRK